MSGVTSRWGARVMGSIAGRTRAGFILFPFRVELIASTVVDCLTAADARLAFEIGEHLFLVGDLHLVFVNAKAAAGDELLLGEIEAVFVVAVGIPALTAGGALGTFAVSGVVSAARARGLVAPEGFVDVALGAAGREGPAED